MRDAHDVGLLMVTGDADSVIVIPAAIAKEAMDMRLYEQFVNAARLLSASIP